MLLFNANKIGSFFSFYAKAKKFSNKNISREQFTARLASNVTKKTDKKEDKETQKNPSF